jgi:hypothetical protein
MKVRKNSIIPTSRGFNFKIKVAHLVVQDLHHEGIRSMSNLGMTPGLILFYLCGLRLVRHSHAQHHEFKEGKKSLIKINLVMSVWKIGYIEMHDCNL